MAGLAGIPLSLRIERVKQGYASDPAYVEGCIRHLADMPLEKYMESDRIAYDLVYLAFGKLRLPWQKGMTACGAACILKHAEGDMPPGWRMSWESAVRNLAKPLSPEEPRPKIRVGRYHEKMPLAEHLRMAGTRRMPAAGGLFLEDFLKGAGEVSGDGRISMLWEQKGLPLAGEMGKHPRLAEAVAEARGREPGECAGMLAWMLIEPLAAVCAAEKEEEEENG